KYENEFNNGITHFLEHLLFDGTKTKSRTDITEGIKSKGGYINAFTQKDLTAYMVVMPKEFIEQGVETQADMLFNSIFPEEELAKERKIVIEEIKKDKDNIQEQVSDFFDSQVFANTPYARPVLGYENIISNLGKDEIADYYHTYYKPNNMIALLIGDFQENQMKKLIERYFGNIPAQILSQDTVRQAHRPEQGRRTEFVPVKAKTSYSPPKEIAVKRKELPTQSFYIDISFSGPLYSNPDFYAFDILSKLLSSEESSPLSQALLGGEKPLANQVSVDLNMQEEFTKLNIQVITDSASLKMQNSHKVEAILNKTVEVLNKLSEKPPSKATLERILVSTKTEDYLLEERLHFYGMLKAGVIVNAGYEFLENYIPNLEKVQPREIQRVAKKYLYKTPYFATVNAPLSNKEKMEETKSTSSYRKEVLPNGLTVIVKSNPDSKVLAINILGKNRSAVEPEGKEGIADFTNRMLLKGTRDRTAEELSNDLASIGAQITNVDNPYIPYDDRYTTKSFTFFRFETIDEYADKGIDILADIIKNSNFPQDQIEKVKAEVMGLLGMQSGSTYQTARDLFYAELFKGHPFSKTINGNRRSIGGITQEDLIEFYKKFYSPNNIIITAITNLPVDEMMNKIKLQFGDMPKADFVLPDIPLPTKPTSPSRVEKKMEKEQVYIYLGSLLPGVESQDMPAIEVTNEILSSRLAQELR
ncbi:MAG: insulinase family protein, partial [candidate division Zixibacteria bacterium]|nr:insulinase family protein [candidate division Zixibacteria bacterium]